MQSLGIVLMCVVAAVCYGIAHDQVTARVCVEYFTVGHPPVFGTDDPTLLGIAGGTGCRFGYLCCTSSKRSLPPRRSSCDFVTPIGRSAQSVPPAGHWD